MSKKNGRVTARTSPMTRRVDGVVWLQVVEAAQRLEVTRGRIYHLIGAGRLRTRLFDGLLYVRDQDVRLHEVVRRETAQAVTAVG